MDIWDELISGHGTSAKFETPGDTCIGTVIKADRRQSTDYTTKQPATFTDGSPKNQYIVTVQTDQRQDPDDDGVRSIYIKDWGQPKRAFQEAIKQGGKPLPGAWFRATFTGFEQGVQGRSPAKLMEYEIRPAQDGGDGNLLAAPANPTQAAPAAYAPPRQYAPAPTAAAAGDDPMGKVQQLIALGKDDQWIASQLGLDAAVVAMVRGA